MEVQQHSEPRVTAEAEVHPPGKRIQPRVPEKEGTPRHAGSTAWGQSDDAFHGWPLQITQHSV